MKWIIILTVIAGICFVYLLIQAIIDGIEAEPISGTIMYPDEEEIFSKFEDDEHSPENVISDDLIKTVSLRNRLNKIEEERETRMDDVNIDYQNYEGK